MNEQRITELKRLIKRGEEKITDIDDRLIDSEDTIDELEKLSLRTFETLNSVVDWMTTTDGLIQELHNRIRELETEVFNKI